MISLEYIELAATQNSPCSRPSNLVIRWQCLQAIFIQFITSVPIIKVWRNTLRATSSQFAVPFILWYVFVFQFRLQLTQKKYNTVRTTSSYSLSSLLHISFVIVKHNRLSLGTFWFRPLDFLVLRSYISFATLNGFGLRYSITPTSICMPVTWAAAKSC